jgi:hypothetical protein
VGGGDAMDFFSVAFLAVRHCAQNRGQDHAWAVDPSQGFMQLDWALGFGTRDPWGSDGVIRGDAFGRASAGAADTVLTVRLRV